MGEDEDLLTEMPDEYGIIRIPRRSAWHPLGDSQSRLPLAGVSPVIATDPQAEGRWRRSGFQNAVNHAPSPPPLSKTEDTVGHL